MQNNNTILLKFVVENSTLKQDYTNNLCKIQLDQVAGNQYISLIQYCTLAFRQEKELKMTVGHRKRYLK